MTVLDPVILALLLGGTVLVLGEVPWFRRRPLHDRLQPYARGTATRRPTMSTGSSITRVLAPSAVRIGARISRSLGANDDLQLRLERGGSTEDAAGFRLRQLARTLAVGVAAIAGIVALDPSPALAVMMAFGPVTLCVLHDERAVSVDIERRQDRRRAELPVVVEQLGLLLSAGYSLPGALTRLSERTDGVVAEDLRRVMRRIRQGLGEAAALDEWADRADQDSIRRLVAVLALHDESGDLGALIAEEAASIRAEAHRSLIESIERRAQLVWVPVTVATLVPGLIFLAVPFMSAMAQVTGGS